MESRKNNLLHFALLLPRVQWSQSSREDCWDFNFAGMTNGNYFYLFIFYLIESFDFIKTVLYAVGCYYLYYFLKFAKGFLILQHVNISLCI